MLGSSLLRPLTLSPPCDANCWARNMHRGMFPHLCTPSLDPLPWMPLVGPLWPGLNVKPYPPPPPAPLPLPEYGSSCLPHCPCRWPSATGPGVPPAPPPPAAEACPARARSEPPSHRPVQARVSNAGFILKAVPFKTSGNPAIRPMLVPQHKKGFSDPKQPALPEWMKPHMATSFELRCRAVPKASLQTSHQGLAANQSPSNTVTKRRRAKRRSRSESRRTKRRHTKSSSSSNSSSSYCRRLIRNRPRRTFLVQQAKPTSATEREHAAATAESERRLVNDASTVEMLRPPRDDDAATVEP